MLQFSVNKKGFSSEILLDTESLLEDYNNDENGLFLNIDSRIRYILNKSFKSGNNLNEGYATSYDYYDDETALDEDFIRSTEHFRMLQKVITSTVFQKHKIRADIYNFTSSHNDMNFYLFKLFFIPKVISPQLESSEFKITNPVPKTSKSSLKDGWNYFVDDKGLDNNIINKLGNQEKIAGVGVITTDVNTSEKSLNTNNQVSQLEKKTTTELLGYPSAVFDQIKSFRQSLLLRKMKMQKSGFNCIQIQFIFLILVLVTLIISNFVNEMFLID